MTASHQPEAEKEKPENTTPNARRPRLPNKPKSKKLRATMMRTSCCTPMETELPGDASKWVTR